MNKALLCVILVTQLATTAKASPPTTSARVNREATSTKPQSADQAPARSPHSSVSPDVALRRAYQREYAFLEAQRASLQKRVEAVHLRADEDKQAADETLQALGQKLLADQLAADRAEADLARRQGSQAEGDDGSSLDTVLEQLRAADASRRIESPIGNASMIAESNDPSEAGSLAKDLARSFAAYLTAMEGHRHLRVDTGSFFGVDGARVEGKVMQLSGVASFGIANDVGGALAPAGGGLFGLWPETPDSPSTAPAVAMLFAGRVSKLVPAILYDTKDTALSPPSTKSFDDVMRAGGAIGWVIVGLGLAALFLALVRMLSMVGVQLGSRRGQEALGLIRSGQAAKAEQQAQVNSSATARVLRAAFVAGEAGRPTDEAEAIVEEALLREFPTVDRFGAAILVVAAASPLLGLLGTVTGMIATFDVIGTHGTGDPKLLSGGISEALVTTELGLCVAIPALLFGNLLQGWGERIKRELELVALSVLNQLRLERGEAALAALARTKSSPLPVANLASVRAATTTSSNAGSSSAANPASSSSALATTLPFLPDGADAR